MLSAYALTKKLAFGPRRIGLERDAPRVARGGHARAHHARAQHRLAGAADGARVLAGHQHAAAGGGHVGHGEPCASARDSRRRCCTAQPS